MPEEIRSGMRNDVLYNKTLSACQLFFEKFWNLVLIRVISVMKPNTVRSELDRDKKFFKIYSFRKNAPKENQKYQDMGGDNPEFVAMIKFV